MLQIPKLSSFLKPASQDFIGIDLGKNSIKGLFIKDQAMVDYFIEEGIVLSKVLKKVTSTKKFPTKLAKVSLKDPSCLVRYFSFPKLERKKMQQAISYELKKFIPFPPDDVYFDFSIIKENSPSEVSVLLAVAKKNYINKILSDFESAGLIVLDITLDSICLMNIFFNNYKDSDQANVCLLDMGYNFSTMSIIDKGVPFLTRDVNFSVKDILEVISRVKNIPIDKIINKIYSADNSEFLDLSQDNILNLCKEIKSSFDYFEVNRGEPVQKVYVTGGAVSIPGIVEKLSTGLETKVSALEIPIDSQENIGKLSAESDFLSLKNRLSVVFGFTF